MDGLYVHLVVSGCKLFFIRSVSVGFDEIFGLARAQTSVPARVPVRVQGSEKFWGVKITEITVKRQLCDTMLHFPIAIF